jgi:CyaY protein
LEPQPAARIINAAASESRRIFIGGMLALPSLPRIARATLQEQNINHPCTHTYIAMDDKEFNLLAQAAMSRIQAGLENAELDFEAPVDGVVEIEFDDGSKMVVNRHNVAREIWVAARSGGFHFRPEDGNWRDTRDGEDLFIKLARLIAQQGGVTALF